MIGLVYYPLLTGELYTYVYTHLFTRTVLMLTGHGKGSCMVQ